jgi:hypothetical protein
MSSCAGIHDLVSGFFLTRECEWREARIGLPLAHAVRRHINGLPAASSH